MKAVDTNVVLRMLMRDDARQASIADQLFGAPVLVPLTVLVEVAWVLGSTYRLPRTAVASMLRNMIDRSTITVEAAREVIWAIERFAARGDFADMLHLVAARSATSFATFDRGVEPAAGPNTPVPVETLA